MTFIYNSMTFMFNIINTSSSKLVSPVLAVLPKTGGSKKIFKMFINYNNNNNNNNNLFKFIFIFYYQKWIKIIIINVQIKKGNV